MTHRQHAIDLDESNAQIEYFRRGDGIGSRTVLLDADACPEQPFDETLWMREDPELWTRLLGDLDVAKVDDALAVKQRRDDSLTSDIDRIYEAEQREIDLLCEKVPELNAHREAREYDCEISHGRRLLRDGQTNRAAKVLLAAGREYPEHRDYRLAAMLACAGLPVGGSLAFRGLERLQEVLR